MTNSLLTVANFLAMLPVNDPLTAGVIKILNYAMVTLLVLIPLAGAVMLGITALKKIQCTDESEMVHLNKRIKSILIYVAVGEVASGLITWLITYFK